MFSGPGQDTPVGDDLFAGLVLLVPVPCPPWGVAAGGRGRHLFFEVDRRPVVGSVGVGAQGASAGVGLQGRP